MKAKRGAARRQTAAVPFPVFLIGAGESSFCRREKREKGKKKLDRVHGCNFLANFYALRAEFFSKPLTAGIRCAIIKSVNKEDTVSAFFRLLRFSSRRTWLVCLAEEKSLTRICRRCHKKFSFVYFHKIPLANVETGFLRKIKKTEIIFVKGIYFLTKMV